MTLPSLLLLLFLLQLLGLVPLADPELGDLRARVRVPPLRRHLLHHGGRREGQRGRGIARPRGRLLVGVRVGPLPDHLLLLLLLLGVPGKVLLPPPVMGMVVIR